MTLETKFDHQQRVHIPELNLSGKVTAIYLTEPGVVQYSVRYFDKATPQSAYFHESELTAQLPDRAEKIAFPKNEAP